MLSHWVSILVRIHTLESKGLCAKWDDIDWSLDQYQFMVQQVRLLLAA